MSKLLFLVDDTDSILTIAASILENDYRVLTMPSAGKMLSLLEKKRPDLIILDIEMPGMNGFEAIEALKANQDRSDIPVLFLTGYIDDDVRARVEASGALDVIEKAEITTILHKRVSDIFNL